MSAEGTVPRASRLPPCVCAVLGAAALAMASGLHAAGLFLPVEPADATQDVVRGTKSGTLRSASMAPEARWERRVRVARDALHSARRDVEGGGEGALLLNMDENVDLDVVVERTAPTKWGYSLSGRVAGGRVGFVTLVVHDEAVAGHIWTLDGAYEVAPVRDGIHALREVPSAPVECAGALQPDLPAVGQIGHERGDGVSVVDILMLWTSTLEAELGADEVLSVVDLFVAVANDAFERSGALVSLNLVGAEKVNYSDENSDIGTTLDRLESPDDGYMDSIHGQRDVLGADLVHIVVARGAFRGYYTVGVAGREFGATIGSTDRALTFAHEVGHNFGILHGRSDIVLAAYRHGFVTEQCEVTIMGSYRTECIGRPGPRIPFFASPWRYHPRTGHALGVSRFSKERGPLGPADAVRTINWTRHVIANFRERPSGDDR